MQDCYVGDIGDFGKYGLLRALSGMGRASIPGARLRLGIVWYRHPDEHTDGKHTSYLKATGLQRDFFRDCDPPLYDTLKRLVDEKHRNIFAIQQCGILSGDTLFYGTSLSYRHGDDRMEKRRIWLTSALEVVSEADVVFVDPDNGIASERIDPWRKIGPKYVFMDDLHRFHEQGHSLVIYHHLGRTASAEQQVARWAGDLQHGLGLSARPPALRWRRGTNRVYFIVAQPSHAPLVERALATFSRGTDPWCAHFDVVT